MMLGSPISPLCILVFLKFCVDIPLHIREHKISTGDKEMIPVITSQSLPAGRQGRNQGFLGLFQKSLNSSLTTVDFSLIILTK